MTMKIFKRLFFLMLITAVMLCTSAPAYASGTCTVSGQTYSSLEEAVIHLTGNDSVIISGDIVLTSNVTLPAGSFISVVGNTTINLGSYTLSGIDNSNSDNANLIYINPGSTLTVTGAGKISYRAEYNRAWNKYSSVISNQRGTLIVNGATIEHLGGTDMAYAVDNLTNGEGTQAYTTINSGYLGSTYIAIRQFANGTQAQNVVTVNGGTLSGGSRAVRIQSPNTDANTATFSVASSASVSRLTVDFEKNLIADISVAANAVGSVAVEDEDPVGIILANVNGVYKVYNTVQEAFTAAGENGSVGLVHNVKLTSDVVVPNGVTVNLNGYNVTEGNLRVDEGDRIDVAGNGQANVNGNSVSGGNRVTAGAGNEIALAPIPAGNPAPDNNPVATAPAAPVVENVYYIPATDDNSNMALWSILALALLTTAFVTRKRKSEN